MVSILWPMIALVALTAVIWVLMYGRRLAEIRSERINPQDLATVDQAQARLRDVSAAENFGNLLETPLLFYLLCLALYVTESASPTFIWLAWIFVVYGQCTVSFT